MVSGRIHSVESFGTVDGPGIRMVVFVQGCPMRCLYCHNPDTWLAEGGTLISPQELLEQYQRNAPFYRGGGLTVSGGEPLLQKEFVTDLFTQAQARGIHTCLDTSGIAFDPDHPQQVMPLLAVTDLVLLDIKQIHPQRHRQLTGHDNRRILEFARLLDQTGVEMWIRHVYVNQQWNSPQDLMALGEFLGSLKHVRAVDVLPYHTMGEVKYQRLGLDYPLKGIAPASAQQAREARQTILQGMRKARREAAQSEVSGKEQRGKV